LIQAFDMYYSISKYLGNCYLHFCFCFFLFSVPFLGLAQHQCQNTCLMCVRTWVPFPALITSTHKNYDPKPISKFIFFQTFEVQLVYWEFFSNISKYFASTCGLAKSAYSALSKCNIICMLS
jgi:hypothetical protein